MSEAVSLVPGKSDADKAKELLARLEKALLPACAIMDEIRDAGFVAAFSFGIDARNRNIISLLKIAKEYT
jgi:hypothetical protein